MQRGGKRALLGILAGLLVLLAACGGPSAPPEPPGPITITGEIGVAQRRAAAIGQQDLSPLALPRRLGISGLNERILEASGSSGLSSQARGEPIRGLNAAVLESVLQAQSGERALFNLSGQSVMAVDRDGNVLADSPIAEDGSWALTLRDEVWAAAGVIGLMQGYESRDGWVCSKPLEYENGEGNRTALFGYADASQTLRLQQSDGTVRAGLFNYHEDTGNPASDEDESDLPVTDDDDFYDDDEPHCDADTTVTTQVTAAFEWTTPGVLPEAQIYETGVGFGLDTQNLDDPSFVNVAPLDPGGNMNMRIIKPQGDIVRMALVMSDAGLIKLETLDDLARFMPFTPTFDLNAAIRYGNPDEPAVIEVGDDGYAYGDLFGGMAYLSGTVRLSSGAPAANALVLGVLDSEEIIAFNLAMTLADGGYELLLPATDANLPYYIIAISEDESEVGIPQNVPPFRGDASEIRYAITQAAAYLGADIQLVTTVGGEPGEEGAISGTVSAPPGTDVSGTAVFACLPDYSDCPAFTAIEQSGASAPYTLSDVPSGSYTIIALNDIDGDGNADFFGFYSQDGSNPTPVSPPAQNIDISMVDVNEPLPPDGETISGTVTAPPGGDVSGTLIYFCDDEGCYVGDFIEQSGSSAPYTITEILPGQYAIFAWKDVDGSDWPPAEGDYFGCYTQTGEQCDLVSPPASGVDIAMWVIEDGGGGDGGISGTVIAPQGGDVNGTLVFFCDDEGCYVGDLIEQSGNSAPYSIADVAAGQYAVWAWTDVNGSEWPPDEGDYFGCYTETGEQCDLVSPPASGVDIPMWVVDAEGLNALSRPPLERPRLFRPQPWREHVIQNLHLYRLQRALPSLLP
jgi:uncharacterized protein (DUF2141 family)